MNRFYLPQLEEVEINDYTLYNSPLIIDLSKKLNIIYGTNGMGKTTLLLIIIYSIIGPYRGNIKTKIYQSERRDNRPIYIDDFFKSRMLTLDKNANVLSRFKINNDEYIVRHSLFENKLISVNRNGEALVGKQVSYKTYENKYTSARATDNTDLNEYLIFKYHSCLEKSTQLPGGINTLISMLLDVMFFDEDRKYTFWQPSLQQTIIAKYIVDADFYSEFVEKKLATKALETAYKKKSETANFLTKFLEKEAIKEKQDKGENGKLNLEIQSEISVVESDIQVLKSNLSELKLKYNRENEQLITLVHSVEQLHERINSLDETWYNNLFPDQYNIYYKRFKNKIADGICPLCGKKHAFTIQMDHCIFCNQPLEINKTLSLVDVDLERRNVQLNLEKYNGQVQDQKEYVDSIYNEITKTQKEISKLFSHKKDLEISLNPDINAIEDSDQKRLTDARNDRDEALQIYNKSKREEEEMRNIVENKLASNFQLFSKYFCSYAKAFFGETHDIKITLPFSVQDDDSQDDNNDDLMIKFELDQRVRDDIYMLSESQRIFTDLSFRFTILTTFHNASFFICETPDSTLDIFHERNAVETFKGYINSGNTLILTANARRSNLISLLYNYYGNDNSNIVDLTQKSKLSNSSSLTLTFENYIRGNTDGES